MKSYSVAFFGILGLLSCAIQAHRFICNTLSANGIERQDSCGICDEEHAPRWSDPTISVLVGTKVTPLGISADEWWKVVQEAFKAWESVPGTSIKFELKRGDADREFGANERVHELFVITDKEEWLRKVGAGPGGVLGATSPKYECQGAPEGNPNGPQKREIIDSDLVINATGSVNWKINCQDDSCVDPLTTLVHEIGHWFGLDHPCLLCDWSIMSARTGSNLIYPVFDDMQGLRALYPDMSNLGGFGFSCAQDSDCSSGLCLNNKAMKYCSNACKSDEDCHKGASCVEHESSRTCEFASGEATNGKREGDSCDFSPCVEPLVCAGASHNAFYCFKPCRKDSSCGLGQECIKIKNRGICVAIKQLGETCDGHELCADDLYCLIEHKSGYCRQACGLVDPHGTGCPPEHSCKYFGPKQELCIPDELKLNTSSASFNEHPSSADSISTPLDTAPEPQASQSFSGCWAFNLDNNFNILYIIFSLLSLKILRSRRANS